MSLLFITCEQSKNPSRIEKIKNLLNYLELEVSHENIKKYGKYVNNEIIEFIYSENDSDLFKSLVEYLENSNLNFQIENLSFNNILLIVKVCRIASSGHELIMEICKKHFVFDPYNGLNNEIAKAIGLSFMESQWLIELEKKYFPDAIEFRSLIERSLDLSIKFSKYEQSSNSYVSSELDKLVDQYLKLIRNSPNIYRPYIIIKNLQSIDYPYVIETMVDFIDLGYITSDYNSERIASICVILRKISEFFHIYQNKLEELFIERSPRIVSMCKEIGILELLGRINVDNILNKSIRSDILYAKHNIKNIITKLLILSRLNYSYKKSEGNIDSYLIELNESVTSYFSTFQDSVKQAINDHKLKILSYIFYNIVEEDSEEIEDSEEETSDESNEYNNENNNKSDDEISKNIDQVKNVFNISYLSIKESFQNLKNVFKYFLNHVINFTKRNV